MVPVRVVELCSCVDLVITTLSFNYFFQILQKSIFFSERFCSIKVKGRFWHSACFPLFCLGRACSYQCRACSQQQCLELDGEELHLSVLQMTSAHSQFYYIPLSIIAYGFLRNSWIYGDLVYFLMPQAFSICKEGGNLILSLEWTHKEMSAIERKRLGAHKVFFLDFFK